MGCAVSIDSNRLVVGSSGNSQTAHEAGAAYVFERIGTNWVGKAKLLASDGQPGDRFGYSLGVAGNEAVVGAYRHNYY